jgi:hypothetical protein
VGVAGCGMAQAANKSTSRSRRPTLRYCLRSGICFGNSTHLGHFDRRVWSTSAAELKIPAVDDDPDRGRIEPLPAYTAQPHASPSSWSIGSWSDEALPCPLIHDLAAPAANGCANETERDSETRRNRRDARSGAGSVTSNKQDLTRRTRPPRCPSCSTEYHRSVLTGFAAQRLI